MPKQSFRIVMKTSIGERCGTMTAEWEEGMPFPGKLMRMETAVWKGRWYPLFGLFHISQWGHLAWQNCNYPFGKEEIHLN